MKARIKEPTSRSKGWGNGYRKEKLRQYVKGRVQYFKLTDMRKLLKVTDGWYRRRLRMVIWKQRKRIKTKVTISSSWVLTDTRRMSGRMPGKAIGTLSTVLSLTVLLLTSVCEKPVTFSSRVTTKRSECDIKEPSYTRTVRTVVWEVGKRK
jgi:hypothetical protein